MWPIDNAGVPLSIAAITLIKWGICKHESFHKTDGHGTLEFPHGSHFSDTVLSNLLNIVNKCIVIFQCYFTQLLVTNLQSTEHMDYKPSSLPLFREGVSYM